MIIIFSITIQSRKRDLVIKIKMSFYTSVSCYQEVGIKKNDTHSIEKESIKMYLYNNKYNIYKQLINLNKKTNLFLFYDPC